MGKKYIFFLLLSFFTHVILQAQVVSHESYTFTWHSSEGIYNLTGNSSESNQFFTDYLVLPAENDYKIIIAKSSVYKLIPKNRIQADDIPLLRPKVTQELINGELRINIFPYYLNKLGQVVLLSEVSLKIIASESTTNDDRVTMRGFQGESVFADGGFYKIGIKKSGPVRLTKDFFDKNNIPIQEVDPRNIQIWGHDTGILPMKNSSPRTDDIKEIPVYQKGFNDGKFDADDYIIFYGIGPEQEVSNETVTSFRNNPYSNHNYYFIKLGMNKASTVQVSNDKPQGGESQTDKISIIITHENDQVNLLEMQAGNSGSGLSWFGELINGGKSIDFSHLMKDYEGYSGGKLRFQTAFAGRHSAITTITNIVNEKSFQSLVTGTNLHDNERAFAYVSNIRGEVNQAKPNTLVVKYDAPAAAKGWLDYIDINLDAQLRVYEKPYRFSMPYGEQDKIILKGNHSSLSKSSIHLWDITDPYSVKRIMPNSQANESQFLLKAVNESSKYLVFDEGKQFSDVSFIEKVLPQNLHGLDHADMLIISYPDFMEASERLADFRRHHNDFVVEVIDVDEIYNEFSSGRSSPIAIRDFIKMVYDRSDLRYVILMGDATFDYRNILTSYPDHNFVPTAYTKNSILYFESFNYDDFYALLDENEGDDIYGDIDISIGRIPATNIQEAENVIDKIIHYESSPEALGDWRLRSVFIGDDDEGRFMKDSNKMADSLQKAIPAFSTIKILLDAFIQEFYADGERYPEANKTLNNSIHTGALIVNYIGHGGPSGWTQERVLSIQDIHQWNNFDRLPLFITATCTFTAYDNPGFTSGGEVLLMKKNGGGIALYSTTRPVYNSHNMELTEKAFKAIYDSRNAGSRKLGDMLRVAKNSLSSTYLTNSRKFILLGDPAMELAVPQFNVVATQINSMNIEEFTDTLAALQNITVEGEIRNENDELLSGFNGVIIPMLYDKAIIRETLGQEATSQVFKFKQQENILFKGKASVVNGRFKFDFTLPKDIDYSIGHGKFTFYAYSTESMMDAMGLADSIYIGGINENEITDDQPPLIKIFLDDTTFVNGDYTNSNPLLIAHLSDKETGINVAGQSIGHDIIAYLDDDISTSVVLNNFYSAELDNPKAGTLSYPLSGIEPGPHKLTMQAWDLANNMGIASIDFVVTKEKEILIMDTKAVPNPFSSSSQILIKHNMGGKNLKVQIPFFDALGRNIFTIEREYENAPSTLTDIIIDSKSFPAMAANMYFYSVIMEHKLFTGEIIKISDNDNKLIYVK